MKIVFLGTPEFAVPVLKAIHSSNHQIVGVISQPDRAVDKKGQLIPTPVKQCSAALNLPVYQFEKVSRDGLSLLDDLCPDAMVTAAYGQLLSEEFLSKAKLGVYNIHASLLPKYRGSSPIQAAILNGETRTGVTVMRTVYKMDAGDILDLAECDIDNETTFLSLHDELSQLGASLIIKTLYKLENGEAVFTPQDEARATYTKKIEKADGVINWSDSGFNIVRKINAFNPWPCAFTFYKADNLKIYKAHFVEMQSNAECGTILSASEKVGLAIKCGGGALYLDILQAPGKKAMNVSDFLRGYKIENGTKLG